MIWLGALCLAIGGNPASLSAHEIATRVEQADVRRLSELAAYTGLRRYSLNNERFHKQAELTARIVFEPPSRKRFTVLSTSGAKAAVNRVLRKMVEAESEASATAQESRVTLRNYDFELAGSTLINGRQCYILTARPKHDTKFLFRGRIWVDAEEFAIVRVEGSPARNPSMFVRKAEFFQTYQKFGPVWLATRNESHTDAWIFGPTTVTIEYYDYQLQSNKTEAASSVSPGQPREQAVKALR